MEYCIPWEAIMTYALVVLAPSATVRMNQGNPRENTMDKEFAPRAFDTPTAPLPRKIKKSKKIIKSGF